MRYFKTYSPPLAVALSALLLLAQPACRGGRKLVGKWNRVSGGVCNELYPNSLEFLNDGTYVGGRAWNGGDYKLVDRRRVKLATLTGPGLYEFKLAGDVLTFTADRGCELKFRRVKNG